MTSIVVLGGGACGLTAAYTLARAGVEVTVLERETRVGGLCGTHERDGFRFDLGGHRFISRSAALQELVRELVGDSLLTRTRSSVVLHGGRRYRYPLDLGDVLGQVSLGRGARVIGSYLGQRARRRLRPAPDVSFEDWVTHRFGRALYDDFFGPYTEKLWGLSPTQISADWASQRISLLSLSDVMLRLVGLRRGGARTYARRYLYPKLGIGQIFERMAERMIADGGRLVGGARVTGLETQRGRVRAVRYTHAGREHEIGADAVISTLALPALARMLGRGTLCAPVARAADRLRFRAIRLCNVLLDLPEVSPHTWMYVSEPRYLMARIQEPRQRSPFAAPPGKTSLMLEIPCHVGDEVWSAPQKDIYDRCMDELAHLGFGGLRGATMAHFSTYVEEGYPIYHLDYQSDRARLLSYVGARRQSRQLRTPGLLPLHLHGHRDGNGSRGRVRDPARRRRRGTHRGAARGRRPHRGTGVDGLGEAMRRLLLVLSLGMSLSCKNDAAQPPLPQGTPTPNTYFTAQTTDKTFYVADHFFASIEMQISGEPFAQLLGRNLAGYDRFNSTPDLYLDPTTGQSTVDPLSYSMAVESYEYSKQPMNNTSFESGAGLSLQFGPILNPSNVTNLAAFNLLHDRVQAFALDSSAGGPSGTNWVVSPSPVANPLNVYGWPGFWPVYAEFQKFQPDVEPSAGATRGCSFAGGYAAASMGAQIVGDYECGYNSLNLPNREAQVTKLLEPDALGFAAWKQGLWVINYWQTLHDLGGNGITQVADADLAQIGQPGNQIVGQYPDPNDPTGKTMLDGTPGVYLGDIPLEGFQGLTMIEEMHNKAALLLQHLLTSDGATLGGFPSTKAAIGYDYTSPLMWWPASVSVTETGTAEPPSGLSWQLFPQPTAFTIVTASSRLRGLLALAGGFAEMFALTDFNNAEVGGQPSSRATFDGDPFAADNQLPDGEDTPHDRALAAIKVAVVDMDRLHFDPDNHVLVDESTVSNGTLQLGQTVSAVVAGYAIVGLRTALRSNLLDAYALLERHARHAGRSDGARRRAARRRPCAAAGAHDAAHPRPGRLHREQVDRRRRLGGELVRSRRRAAGLVADAARVRGERDSRAPRRVSGDG